MAKSKADYWLTTDGLTLLRGWARDGLTDEQIAHNMEISVATLYNYKNKYSEILEALKKGKEIVDYEVENSLLKKALGYTKTLNKQKVTNLGEVIDYQEEVHIAPDTTAIIYWLNNRKPKQWRNKQDKDNNDALEKLDKLLKEQENA